MAKLNSYIGSKEHERDYRNNKSIGIKGGFKHRALRSRMMASVDAPNSKGFDVKR